MPYDRLSELPDGVKNTLPKHGLEIYKEAFNNAWQQYASPEKRRGNASREEVAHKVAWSAVKSQYKKKGSDWVRKN